MVNGIDIDLLRSWLCCSAILENRELRPSYILNTSNPVPTFNILSIPYSYSFHSSYSSIFIPFLIPTQYILLFLQYSFHSLFLIIPFCLSFNIHSIPHSYSFHSWFLLIEFFLFFNIHSIPYSYSFLCYYPLIFIPFLIPFHSILLILQY